MKGVALTEEESFDICNVSNVIKQLDQTCDATSVWDPYGVWYSVSTTNWIEEETWQRSGRLFVRNVSEHRLLDTDKRCCRLGASHYEAYGR